MLIFIILLILCFGFHVINIPLMLLLLLFFTIRLGKPQIPVDTDEWTGDE